MTKSNNNTYCGKRENDSVIITVKTGTKHSELLTIHPKRLPFKHEDSFDYGEMGDEQKSLQLSLAILACEDGPESAIKFSRFFLENIISKLPDTWTLTSKDLIKYVKKEKSVEVK